MGRDAPVHRAAHAGHRGRAVARRASARIHARTGRPSRAPAGSHRHPGDRHRPRRTDHVPRAGPGRRVSAAGPAPSRHLREGTGLPSRTGSDPDARIVRRGRPSGQGRAGRLRSARGEPGDGRVHRPRQDRRAGDQGHQRPQLPWPGAERGHGPRALLADQPLRLRKAAGGRHGTLDIHVGWNDAAARLAERLQTHLS